METDKDVNGAEARAVEADHVKDVGAVNADMTSLLVAALGMTGADRGLGRTTQTA